MWRLPSGWIKLLSTCGSGGSWSRRSIPNYFQCVHVAFMDKGQTFNLILLINLNVNLIDLNSCLMTTQDMILRAYYCWVAAMLTHTHTPHTQVCQLRYWSVRCLLTFCSPGVLSSRSFNPTLDFSLKPYFPTRAAITDTSSANLTNCFVVACCCQYDNSNGENVVHVHKIWSERLRINWQSGRNQRSHDTSAAALLSTLGVSYLLSWKLLAKPRRDISTRDFCPQMHRFSFSK